MDDCNVDEKWVLSEARDEKSVQRKKNGAGWEKAQCRWTMDAATKGGQQGMASFGQQYRIDQINYRY